MTRKRRLSQFCLTLTLTGSVACASNPEPGDPCALSVPPIAGWTSYDEGEFTLQLPPEYASVQVQGIDSQVGRWEAPGKSVSYDLGVYANPLQPNDLNAFPGLEVCQEGDGRGTPRIIRYSPPEGGYTVSAHWADVGQQGAGRTASLTLQGVVQQAEDQGEIFAIIRSVRIETPGREGAGGAGEASPPAGHPTAGARRPDPSAGPAYAGYRAGGNEPFWAVRFGEGTMEFYALGSADTVSATRPEPERLAAGWRFAANVDGGPYIVRIEERRCTDSMSGSPFPHTVMVTVSGQSYSGCGGDTASLLMGEEWVVTRLEDAETTGSQRPTLQFASGGVLTGTGGCNRFRASYEITGEGIRIGPAMTTRMACADPEANTREVRFFALLEQVTRFDITADGSLELLAMDSPVIVAQR